MNRNARNRENLSGSLKKKEESKRNQKRKEEEAARKEMYKVKYDNA